MKQLLSILILIVAFFSCNVNTTYSNRESDKQEAEVIVKQFYEYLKTNQPNRVVNLLSPEFFSVTDTNKLYEVIQKDQEISGNIESYLLANWQTTIVKGTNARSDYLFTYVVRRQKKDTKETIVLQKENEKIKIFGYNVEGRAE